jgi:hypothetical protein
MKVTFRTIAGKSFALDADPEVTVAALKDQVTETSPDCARQGMKLVGAGRAGLGGPQAPQEACQQARCCGRRVTGSSLAALSRGPIPVKQVYKGKVLDDAQSIKDAGVTEDGFVVVFVTAAKKVRTMEPTFPQAAPAQRTIALRQTTCPSCLVLRAPRNPSPRSARTGGRSRRGASARSGARSRQARPPRP